MATINPVTLQDAQDRINVLVNNDVDTPDTADDEWTIRLNLIYQAINNWEASDVQWDELWSTYTHGSTLAAGDRDYTISATDFRFPGGSIRLITTGGTTHVQVISPEQFQRLGGDAQVAYFTGNPRDGYVLNFGWTPSADDSTVGATIKFDYYKYANKPTLVSDKFEMRDPNYVIYWVAAQKSLLESKRNQYAVFNDQAELCMDQMRILNEIQPNYQDNSMEDVDELSFGVELGE